MTGHVKRLTPGCSIIPFDRSEHRGRQFRFMKNPFVWIILLRKRIDPCESAPTKRLTA